MAFECRACRAENEPGDSFCHQCGERLQIVCAECGQPGKPTSRFCSRCGAAFAQQSAKPALREQFDALRSGGGERKYISVLFADLKNSTAHVQGQDPEATLRRIAPVLALMSAAVNQHDGVVAETLGDGVLALFGAPKPLEDHAVRACLAGLAIQQKIAQLNDPSMRIRVGIHSGEAIVKAVDATLTQKLGAIGEVVHFANRIEQLCAPGRQHDQRSRVQAITTIYRCSFAWLPQTSQGIVRADRGLSGRRTAQRAGEQHFQDTREHLQPLAGRVDEIAQLKQLWRVPHAARHASSLSLARPAWVKANLLRVSGGAARRRDISILEARAAPFGEATPLKPMLDLLQDFFRIRPISDPQLRRQTVTTLLQRLPSEPEDEAMILELLGLTQGSGESNKPDPSVRRARLIKFICQLVQQRRDSNPAVVLIEDLHSSDWASMDILDAVVDAVYGSQTMLLLNFRPGLVRDWMQRSHYRALNLESSMRRQWMRSWYTPSAKMRL